MTGIQFVMVFVVIGFIGWMKLWKVKRRVVFEPKHSKTHVDSPFNNSIKGVADVDHFVASEVCSFSFLSSETRSSTTIFRRAAALSTHLIQEFLLM